MEDTCRQILESLPMGVALLDKGGRLEACNPAAAALLSLPPAVATGDVSIFGGPAIPTPMRELEGVFWSAMADATIALDEDREMALATSVGTREIRVRLRRITLGGVPFGLLIVDDNERVKRTERALGAALGEAQDQALRDPLTGLFNRRHIEWVLPAEIKRAERHGSPLSVLTLDLDHFKRINDRFGHPMGDRVLIEFARLLNRILRVGDTCARIGGEEFAVVLPHSDAAAAGRAADRLHRVIRALRFEEEPELRVTASMGVATARPSGSSTDVAGEAARLMANADSALYEAKRAGRNRTVVANATQVVPPSTQP
jgi:diguanylate cyclase (GGDEF)-like protein